MKKLQLIFLALTMTTQSARSQEDKTGNTKPMRYELGFNLFSLTLRPGNFNTDYKMVSDYQAFSGIYFKYHFGQNALRSEINFSKRNLRSNWPFSPIVEKTTSLELKAGYQRSFTKGKFSIYAFADAEYYYFHPEQYYYHPMPYPSLYMYPMPADETRSFMIKGSYFCLSPGLGFRWKLGEHFLLGYEAGAQFFYARTKYAEAYSGIMESVGINVKSARFSIGVNF